MMNPIGHGGVLPAGTEPPAGDVYVLQPGDTFDALVERFGIAGPKAVDAFRRLNPDLALGRARPGSLVTLPAPAGPHAAAAPVGREAAAPAAPLDTSWTRGYGRDVSRQNRYNAELEAARARWPDVDPLVLKSLLAQESGFRSRVVNRYGYAGVAQLGVAEARQVGLRTGHSRMSNARKGVAPYVDRVRDERLVPRKAIPGAARLLRAKAATLERGLETKRWGSLPGFARYGEPEGDDYWRFAAAAYNGGEGTVLLAMRIAYGDATPAEVRWDDLVRSPDGDARHAPLYLAIRRVGMNPAVKFREISEYARDVVRRARQ
jgi:hypothetical protein